MIQIRYMTLFKSTQPASNIYTIMPLPWKGDQMPLTLGFVLVTALFVFFNFSPLASRNSSTFCKISYGAMFRTQMGLVLLLM